LASAKGTKPKKKPSKNKRDEKAWKMFLKRPQKAGERKNVKNQKKRRPHLTFQQVKPLFPGLGYSFLWHFLGRKIFTKGKQYKPL